MPKQVTAQTRAVKVGDIYEHIVDLISLHEIPCLIGPSGIGKTQIVEQVCADMSYDLVPVDLISLDPADVKFPIVDLATQRVTFVPASIFFAGARPKLFFFDEMNHGSTLVQGLCYQMFESKRIGAHALPSDCAIVAAHNRVSDKGVHNRVPMPLRKRMFEFHVEPDLQSWCAWAVKADIEPMVIGFIRWRQELLCPDLDGDNITPDPRAWAKVSSLLALRPDMPQDRLLDILYGKIGEGAAIEFSAFLRLYKDLPNLDAIELNPTREPVPESPATLYAITSAIARRIKVANFSRWLKYLDRMPQEYSVCAVRDAVGRDSALKSTPEFTKWCVAHHDIVM